MPSMSKADQGSAIAFLTFGSIILFVIFVFVGPFLIITGKNSKNIGYTIGGSLSLVLTFINMLYWILVFLEVLPVPFD